MFDAKISLHAARKVSYNLAYYHGAGMLLAANKISEINIVEMVSMKAARRGGLFNAGSPACGKVSDHFDDRGNDKCRTSEA